MNIFDNNVDASSHGLIMIFISIMAILLTGISNIMINTYLQIIEVIYPLLNSISLLLYQLSIIIIVGNIYIIFYGSGWTLYPPLSIYNIDNIVHNSIVIIIGLFISGNSTTNTILNIILSTITGIKILKIHLYIQFIYTIIVTSIQLINVLPAFNICTIQLLQDVYTITIFYNKEEGGNIQLYQHIFWFFGRPEVYILILPIFGIINSIM